MGSPGQGIGYTGGDNKKMDGARIWGALGGILESMNFVSDKELLQRLHRDWHVESPF